MAKYSMRLVTDMTLYNGPGGLASEIQKISHKSPTLSTNICLKQINMPSIMSEQSLWAKNNQLLTVTLALNCHNPYEHVISKHVSAVWIFRVLKTK